MLLKFDVYNNGKPAKDIGLSAAYMFGADTIPLHAVNRIRFADGTINCSRKGRDSAGLALLWPVEGFGRTLLATTRVPERDRPYILNVELARARLMQITLKREDWTMFEESNSFADLAHRAKDLFIESLQNMDEPAKAAELADESLKQAMFFAEKLAAKHAEIHFAARCKARSLGRHSLGCRIAPEMLDNETYYKWLLDMFGFVTIPLSWAQIEPERGYYDFSVIDLCLEKLAGRRMAICAGPLLCFDRQYLPEWLLKGKRGFEKIREAAYGFVSKVVARYARYIHAWRLIGGMNAANHFGFSFEQTIEMTRAACLAARGADPKSQKLVEIFYPWGEYYAHDRNTVPPLVYADTIIQSSINFDAFAITMHFGKDRPGMHLRDMMQISSRLDCFGQVSKPVHITGVAVPDSSGEGDQDCDVAGIWHKKWEPQVQAEWIEQFYRIALSKPFISSITYSNLADGDDMDVRDSGLLNRRMEPKKAFLSLARMQKVILNR